MNSSPVKLDIVGRVSFSITFTNASMEKIYTVSVDSGIPFEDVRRGIPGDEVLFNKGQVLHVRRARLIPRGGPGLQVAADREVAARLKMAQGHSTMSGFVVNTDTSSIPLLFSDWDKWEDKDFEVKFTEDASRLGILENSTFYYMDANLQDDFENANFTPTLELEADLYIGD